MRGKRKRIRDIIKKGKQHNAKFLASCYGKIRHSSYAEAKVEALKKPRFVRPYKCKYGNHYHIGRKREGVKK